jgi:hypothetical protein
MIGSGSESSSNSIFGFRDPGDQIGPTEDAAASAT